MGAVSLCCNECNSSYLTGTMCLLAGASEMMIIHRYHPIVAEDDNNSGDIRLAVVDASPAPAPASAPVPAQGIWHAYTASYRRRW